MLHAPSRLQAGEDSARERVELKLARGVRARTVRASVAILLLFTQLTGCYRYVPVGNASVPSGTLVSVGITDRGRVELAERVGPGVQRIGGEVLSTTDTTVALAVSTVQFMDLSVPLKWTGERLVVSRDLFTDVRERRLSRTRSWITAGIVVLGVVATSLVAIRGFGGDSPGDRPGGNGDDVR